MKQETMTHNLKKNQAIETDPKMTEMIQLANKDEQDKEKNQNIKKNILNNLEKC